MFRYFLAVIVLANVILGHLCMMPVAYASARPAVHGEAIEMVMTPLVPMTPVHCPQCLRVVKVEPLPMRGSCAGNCLSQGPESVAVTSGISQTRVTAAHVPVHPWSAVGDASAHRAIALVEPLGRLFLTNTVVLLQ